MRFPLVAASALALIMASSAAFAQEAKLPSGLPFPAWSPPLTTVPSEGGTAATSATPTLAPKKGVLMEPVYNHAPKKKKKKKAAAVTAPAAPVTDVAKEELTTAPATTTETAPAAPMPEAMPAPAAAPAPEAAPAPAMDATTMTPPSPPETPTMQLQASPPEGSVPSPAPAANDPLAPPAQ